MSRAWGHIFYLYGPREHPSRLVPSVISALSEGTTFVCQHPHDVRDFLHVEDVASAFVALLGSEVEGDVNIASGEPTTVGELVATVAEVMGRPDLVDCSAVAPEESRIVGDNSAPAPRSRVGSAIRPGQRPCGHDRLVDAGASAGQSRPAGGRDAVTRPANRRWRRAAFWLRYQVEVAKRVRRRRRRTSMAPVVAVVYVYPIAGHAEHDFSARRFVSTYRDFPPLGDHRLHVVFNGAAPSAENLAVFDGLDIEVHRHDNTGWDIGAFQMAAREIDCDLIVCLGTNSHFKRAGWLRRMIESVEAHGDGLYGSSASYERDPHIRTTAFWCDPMLIRAYPKQVRTFDDRYEFEASPSSITRLAEHVGLGCWFVTWDGEYPKPEWRTPPNIFRRGDQSNSLVFDRYFEVFDALDSEIARGPRLRR